MCVLEWAGGRSIGQVGADWEIGEGRRDLEGVMGYGRGGRGGGWKENWGVVSAWRVVRREVAGRCWCEVGVLCRHGNDRVWGKRLVVCLLLVMLCSGVVYMCFEIVMRLLAAVNARVRYSGVHPTSACRNAISRGGSSNAVRERNATQSRLSSTSKKEPKLKSPIHLLVNSSDTQPPHPLAFQLPSLRIS